MAHPRRVFLKKGVLGFMSLSLVPTSFAIFRASQSTLSIDDVFSRLSFKPGSVPLDGLDYTFKPTFNESEAISRIGKIYHSGKSVCIPEINQFIPGLKKEMVSIYQSALGRYEKVTSLNHLELAALNETMLSLSREKGISEPEKLKEHLLPIKKTNRHRGSKHFVFGEHSCHLGYYTAKGYCSLKPVSNEKGISVQAKLFDFDQVEFYSNSFSFENLS